MDSGGDVTVLGINWNRKTDNYSFPILQIKEKKDHTKKEITEISCGFPWDCFLEYLSKYHFKNYGSISSHGMNQNLKMLINCKSHLEKNFTLSNK